VKVPATPPSTLSMEAEHLHVHPKEDTLWRIYRTSGPHALNWDQLRHFGPVKKQRWDPHASPRGDDPDAGVMYAATEPTTAFAEVYQQRRLISRSQGGATLVAWEPERDLTLLNLTSSWPVQNGAASSIMMGDKKNTQAWAREIHVQLGADIDGLYAHSSITGRPVVTLFIRTELQPAFPSRPSFHALLDDDSVSPYVARAVKDLKSYRSSKVRP
jgi:hypothetical protein